MHKLTIILVDDSLFERDLFGETLNIIDETINYIPFSSGQTVLHYLENTKTLPNYIFLDIRMPGMDGLECLRHIKSQSRTKDIPVIIYSHAHPSTYQTLAFAFGASSCLSKSTSILESINQISSFIKPRESVREDQN
jgi:CheY-like chemotaxis protein